MKQFKFVLAFSTLLSVAQTFCYRSEFKVRGSAFFPTSSLFRHIYGRAGFNFDAEIATHLYRCLDIWANFDWFSKKGHSIGLCNPTRIRIANFSFGLKGRYAFCDRAALYLGLGPTFAALRLKNCSPCGIECVKKGVVGLVVKSGLDIYFCNRGFIDIFADYVYQPTCFQRRVNIGGVRVGAGLGVRF